MKRLLGILVALAAFAGSASAAERIALVIGNSSYRPGFELRNPVADARAVAAAFSDLGFKVTLIQDTDLATAQRALDAFVPEGIAADAAVIFYAGHGAMINGRNFMLPVDFAMSNFDQLDKEALDTDRLLQTLSSTHAGVKLLLFDACRNNPLESRGATVIEPAGEGETRSDNMVIAFSTAQGMTASDGGGDHSPFAEGLMTNIGRPDEELSALMKAIGDHVRDKTNGHQTVWVESSLSKPFYFTQAAHGKIIDLTPPEPAADQGLVFPQSSQILLTEADMQGKNAATLRLARNEIFARNGRLFNDAALRAHFEKFGWYKGTAFDVALNPIETQNVAFIRQFEMQEGAPKAGFLFADSDRRLLAAGDLSSLSKKSLRNARNEIYARRGRKFKVKEVRDYFTQFDWYRPQFGEVSLTYVEQKNVDLIRSFESR